MKRLGEMWQHQHDSVEKYFESVKPGFALFFEQGCGKTRTSIEILNRSEKPQTQKVLVFTPPVVISNWCDEIKKFSDIKAKALIGPGKKRLDIFMQNKNSTRVFVTNYEALSMPIFEFLKSWQADVIIFDESHKLKSPSSLRSKMAFELTNQRNSPRPKVFLLSGTPILNSPIDIFQQYKVMDGGVTFGLNYFKFRARYFRDMNSQMPSQRHFPDWRVRTLERDGFDALSEINEKIFSLGIRYEKKDCLTLPEEVTIPIKVGMTPKQKKVYEELRKHLVSYLSDSKSVSTPLALTKALRLLQICSGFVGAINHEDNLQYEDEFEDTPKIQALKELFEQIVIEGNHKVIVWAVFKKNYEQIAKLCNEMGIKYVELHGSMAQGAKDQALKDFKEKDDTKVMVSHPGSGGIGINLVEANYSIFYSRNFSLEQYLQAKARNHRAGQQKNVTHYNLVCDQTIDELVLKALDEKQEISDILLKGMINEI